MTKFIESRPVGRDIYVPIRDVIREERLKVEDAEWNGEQPRRAWLNFLLSEQKRGVTMYPVGWERIHYED